MNSYYCIVNMPGVPAREIQVLDVNDDLTAIASLTLVGDRWIGFESIGLYHGERFIRELCNPCFAQPAPETVLNKAA